MDQTKVSGLTAANVSALNQVAAHLCTTTATTATFHGDAVAATRALQEIMVRLPGRGHPKASLHAVLRKLQLQVSPQ